ncbi:two-component system response regulator [Syntrophotalea acetylenivorans]|uniref:Two-component system response regulator n=1 Tax=Syntrophotalea acetylenivorans TaxID=1842532 RepID=A0A1L3GPC2_9BACT|nr:sigma-54 dependent transcriptional regulator [Syntrophotalea acetylenivorans]APG27772.1 two-component system response regulator [Syntrophotalea acetylenivorans]
MSSPKFPNIPLLSVDDEAAWLRSLSLTLKKDAGINNVLRCEDSREVMELLASVQVSMILLDLTMPHLSGEELLSMIVRDYPEIPVIVVSGVNQIETAVRCMRNGARDYFIKSDDTERLIASIERTLEYQRLQQENVRLKERVLQDRLDNPGAFAGIVTRNRRMQALFQYLEAVAHSPEPLLVTGESGVGKELVARAVHELRGADEPWVAVNVAGLDDNVFSDTLFGHAKGAFTGAEQTRGGMIAKAGSGTLFLDEIGDLSAASQVKLLRLLQEGEYYPLGSDYPQKLRARIVVATNVDLAASQAKGHFRKDLYYRLCAHHVHVPSLQERREDLPLLLDHFFEEAAQAMSKKKPTPPSELPVLLATYHFPGNVRELRAMVYDAISLHESGVLSMDSFKRVLSEARPENGQVSPANSGQEAAAGVLFSERLPTLAENAEMLVAEAMKRAQGNQTIAAGLLGITRQALSKRLKKLTS